MHVVRLSSTRLAALALGLLALLAGSLALAPVASAAPPANDLRADAQVISGANGSVEGSTAEATKQADEYGDGGVWFTWTAPADGKEQFLARFSPLDIRIGGPEGPLSQDPTVRNCDTSASSYNCFTIQATEGTTYAILAYSDEADGQFAGPFTLSWSDLAPPPNDDLADAAVIPQSGGFANLGSDQSGELATLEEGEEPSQLDSGQGTHSVWYRWTAPTDDVAVSVDVTVGDPPHNQCFYPDAIAAVYTGTSVTDLTLVAQDTSRGYTGCDHPYTEFGSVAGTTYYIKVDAEGGPAPLRGQLSFSAPCTVMGTTGDDDLVGDPGDDVLCGLGGDDVLRGGGGADELLDGAGNDVALGGPGDDSYQMVRGFDLVSYAAARRGVEVDLGARTATGQGDETLSYYTNGVIGSSQADRLRAGIDSVMRGGKGADVLTGGFSVDRLRGNAGPDRLVGGDGDDSLDGGAGSDVCNGNPSESADRFTDTAAHCESVRNVP